MRILYAIQGTGNGHIARAREIVPLLKQKAQVDVLVSGMKLELDMPFEVKYKFKGIHFVFGKSGGIDLIKTWKKNSVKSIYKEIKCVAVEGYDLVINDFEPITAWACKLKNINCFGLSHQSALLSNKSPKPKYSDWIGAFLLKYYAPFSRSFSFHFDKYDENIYLPIIRSEIRKLDLEEQDHYTIYLPAFLDEKIIKRFKKFKKHNFVVFSKHCNREYEEGNIFIKPIHNDAFIESMRTCIGVITGAGFETPAEALFLGKKLLVIPMKNQYEQNYNAAALEKIGIPVLKNLKKKRTIEIQKWLDSDERISVHYPNQTSYILDLILEESVKESSLNVELSMNQA